ncbi:hypothetical protein J2W25_000040 [Variovorax boronicumulans]|uniref:Uncharacterized protein n=1 Tax=Variovorax boronicumulans TaxID=436515 RepID=A0AAW8DNV8_9BURK|nr:hypothetical protein [Variovorax boronicumulans]MDP9875753.1 hypothetical protein [Variovorax boronicumulans]MDP9919898.1 hypothetical protein [Variovorax boronicumulans]MDP9921035.1 hypothetical protein [Variovorax boronicumulans]
MPSSPPPTNPTRRQKLRAASIAVAVFAAIALAGALFGSGRSGNSTGLAGREICRATCIARGWKDGTMQPPSHATTGSTQGPNACQCR